MAGKLECHGGAIRALIRAEMARRVAECCALVRDHARGLIGAGGTGPSRRSGRLARSVASESEGLVGRVGSELPYARMLELGTRRMRARPWLLRSLRECEGQIRAILGRPIR